MSDFERIVEMRPAFDRRHPDSSKSYGIHGVELRMVLKGERGVVQFVLYTNWQLPHVTEEQDSKPIDSRFPHLMCRPMAADVGYHSPRPMYEGQEPMGSSRLSWTDNNGEWEGGPAKLPKSEPTGTFDPCPYLDGNPCYYDGSGLAAEAIYETLLREGSDGVWEALEARYAEWFLASFVLFESDPAIREPMGLR